MILQCPLAKMNVRILVCSGPCSLSGQYYFLHRYGQLYYHFFLPNKWGRTTPSNARRLATSLLCLMVSSDEGEQACQQHAQSSYFASLQSMDKSKSARLFFYIAPRSYLCSKCRIAKQLMQNQVKERGGSKWYPCHLTITNWRFF